MSRRPMHAVWPLAVCGLLLAACGGAESEQDPSPVVRLEQELRARLQANPQDLEAHKQLADLYYDTFRPAAAIPHYEAFLRARPDDPNARTDLGTCYKRLGNLERARGEYERVLKKHPHHVKALYNLAVVLNLEGRREDAAEFWEKAAQLTTDPELARLARENAASARAWSAALKKAAPKRP